MSPIAPSGDRLQFSAGLPAGDVDRQLRQALIACDRAQASVVLWLAEVQRRGLCGPLGQPSVLQYATESLGMSRPRVFDLLQLARDLERLPLLRAAMANGAVGWTKARLVARVATAATEEFWVDAAQRLGRRALTARIVEEQERARRRREERRRQHVAQLAGQTDLGWTEESLPATVVTLASPPAVSSARTGAVGAVADRSAPTPTRHDHITPAAATQPTVRGAAIAVGEPPSSLTYRLTGIEFARYEALLEQAHRRRRVPPQASREEVLMAAMVALVLPAGEGQAAAPAAAGTPGIMAPTSAGGPADLAILYQVIIYSCKACAAAEVVTSRGRRPLASLEMEAVLCDARVLEPGKPNRAIIPPSVRATVLTRDGHRCQAPGCGRTHFLEVHHVVPRAAGGTNRADNLMTLCGRCHRFAHERPQLVRQWFELREP